MEKIFHLRILSIISLQGFGSAEHVVDPVKGILAAAFRIHAPRIKNVKGFSKRTFPLDIPYGKR